MIKLSDFIGLMRWVLLSKVDFDQVNIPFSLYETNEEYFKCYARTFKPANLFNCIEIYLHPNISDKDKQKLLNMLIFVGLDACKATNDEDAIIVYF